MTPEHAAAGAALAAAAAVAAAALAAAALPDLFGVVFAATCL